MRLDHLLVEIEKKAARCLEESDPPIDHVRELARVALDLVRRLRAGEQPYRSGALDAESDASGEAAALVSLERALDECQRKLADAEAELARARG